MITRGLKPERGQHRLKTEGLGPGRAAALEAGKGRNRPHPGLLKEHSPANALILGRETHSRPLTPDGKITVSL